LTAKAFTAPTLSSPAHFGLFIPGKVATLSLADYDRLETKVPANILPHVVAQNSAQNWFRHGGQGYFLPLSAKL